MTDNSTTPTRAGQHPSVEWDATAYHRLSQPQLAWGERVLDRLSLRGDETLIDAGCGTGRITAELLERLPGGRIIALDQSAAMLEQAREHLAPRFGDRVTFLQADLASLDLDRVAEVIFSTATFHWVKDHPQLFRTLYRALKPGGLLIAQCGGGPNLARLFERSAAIMHSPRYAPFFKGWDAPWEFADAPTTAQRLRAAGFVDVATDVEPARVTLPNAQEYHSFLQTIIFRAHLERIPNESLRHEFMEVLTQQAEQDDPAFHLDYWRLNLQGRRAG